MGVAPKIAEFILAMTLSTLARMGRMRSLSASTPKIDVDGVVN